MPRFFKKPLHESHVFPYFAPKRGSRRIPINHPLGLEPRWEGVSMKSASSYAVSTFYFFKPLENLEHVQSQLEEVARQHSVTGLCILGHEGLNSTVAAPGRAALEAFQSFIKEYFELPQLFFKDSESPKKPFRRFKIKVREEIVTLGTPELVPDQSKNHHLTPEEWNRVLKEDNDVLVIDTRNWYETKMGTFKGAVNPRIDKFTEFPEFVEAQKINKNQKMLIFCTGGIRCEKGILELQRQGFDNVYQLEGGIINYLKEFPNDQFEGECFVFDHRVALDQHLRPSETYGLCPHCGQPAKTKIACRRCDTETLICEDCTELEWKKDTCSKNCAYHYRLHPDRKGDRQVLPHEEE